MRHDSPSGYDLRPALPGDLDWLIELRTLTMTGHLDVSGERLSRADHRRRVLDRFASVRIVTLADTDIGMLKVDRDADSWQLVQIQLLREYQRLGIGTRIVRELLAEARRSQIAATLKVLKSSPAKRLYERLGFRVTGEGDQSYALRIDP